MAVVLWPFRDLPLVLAGAGVMLAFGLYGLLCIVMGALRWEEVQQLWAALSGLCRRSQSNKSAPSGFLPQERRQAAEALIAP
jgi:hypothetical protein